jgi:23S rRNA (guanosine2251-2'-O)-methyltransferase
VDDEDKLDALSEANGPRRLYREDLRARKPDRAGFMEAPRSPIVLVLDGVDGNYNKGALFRLADAFLLERVHFCQTTIEHKHRRFLKSARGTHRWVPYEANEDPIDVIQSYRERGYRIVVAEQCEGSVSLLDADLGAPVCIVLGGELSGVSPEVIAAADIVVELPTMGMANSLNVAMSAGMMVLSAFRSLPR